MRSRSVPTLVLLSALAAGCLLALLIGGAVLEADAQSAAVPATLTGVPVGKVSHPLDFADPHIVRGDDGAWYGYSTSSADLMVQVTRGWSPRGFRHGVREALSEKPPWGTTEVWAPSVEKIDDTWVMFFAGKKAGTDTRCIGTATAATGAGPFQPAAQPIACDSRYGDQLDPSAFRDGTGDWWLLWKRDNPSRGGRQTIVTAQLTNNGQQLLGAPQLLIEADQPWEEGLIENPAMVLATDGNVHLFWSGNDWRGTDYATGHARCSSPAGPCEKDSGVWFSGYEGGAGGASFTTITRGTQGDSAAMVFHRWVAGVGYESGAKRTAHVIPVTFAESGEASFTKAPKEIFDRFGLRCGDHIATVIPPADSTATGGATMTGTRFDDVILGSDGDDTIKGGGGHDRICGGEGDDVLMGGRGKDRLLGGEGADTLKGGRGQDFLNGGGGIDRLNGGKGVDDCRGGGRDIRTRC